MKLIMLISHTDLSLNLHPCAVREYKLMTEGKHIAYFLSYFVKKSLSLLFLSLPPLALLFILHSIFIYGVQNTTNNFQEKYMWLLSHGKRTYSQTKVSGSTKTIFLITILVEIYCRMVTLISCEWGGKAVELERPCRTLVFPFRGKWGGLGPIWGDRGCSHSLGTARSCIERSNRHCGHLRSGRKADINYHWHLRNTKNC